MTRSAAKGMDSEEIFQGTKGCKCNGLVPVWGGGREGRNMKRKLHRRSRMVKSYSRNRCLGGRYFEGPTEVGRREVAFWGMARIERGGGGAAARLRTRRPLNLTGGRNEQVETARGLINWG